MKRLVIGILAHVDSGKTTLSEGLLYNAGETKKLGRVDHGSAFLDTDNIEKERGITIFSKQAMMRLDDCEIALLDTPGHVDFSAEMERTLSVLDYAILVISGTDGVQSHTETVWRLLSHYNIPVFLFVNKMDLDGADRERVIADLKERLGDSVVDFSVQDFYESAAMCDDKLLDEFMNSESISRDALSNAILMRRVYPCFFGSALNNEGVSEFLEALDKYTLMRSYPAEFGARVYKISEDDRGRRLVHMKITGGSLKVKTQLPSGQKVNEIRIYSGAKYENTAEVLPGGICAVTGLSDTFAGDGLGFEPNLKKLTSESVFSYAVKLPDNINAHDALKIFRRLEAEETQLSVVWNEYVQRIDVRIMGEVQLEVLKRILAERFDLCVEFTEGSIIYKETIADTVEGVGHYEPLRHYAEVHLLLEPGKPRSGVQIQTDCNEDHLDKNWQRLILTHLHEREHIGVLTGSPVTDIKITLISGRAHQKHTEGGDFRQATYRAVRQGLMQAKSVLLEPWYSFSAEVPTESVGRLMTDLTSIGAEFSAPIPRGEMSVVSGSAPISKMRDYHAEMISYTRGRGRLNLSFDGYKPCAYADEVIKSFGYNPESDIENTPDSVFCSHGSGYTVKWNEVFDNMHIEARKTEAVPRGGVSLKSQGIIAGEEELLRIFEMTYGKIQRKAPSGTKVIHTKTETYKKPKKQKESTPYILIDGYNIIFAWDDLKEIAEDSLEDARNVLISRICNYQAMKQNNVILVFDAYKVAGDYREVEKIHGITVVYTKEAETADAYIEKTTKELSKNYRVRVATSDNLVQMIIFGDGAVRISAREFLAEVLETEAELRKMIDEFNRENK